MEMLRDRPIFTQTYEKPADFCPAPGSTYIYGRFEQRSEHIDAWQGHAAGVSTILITVQDRYSIETDRPELGPIALRNPSDVARIYGANSDTVYLDITGLSHHVWAPLVRVALQRKIRLNAVYVEPANYRYSPSPRQGEIFDLSERIEGIAPLPLFTSLNEPTEERWCFVPLLGFEGTRFAYIVEQLEPPGNRIVPVVGVPGFQLEYPFHTYLGNQLTLDETKAWRNVRYALANCPFSLFYVLEDVLHDYANDHVKVAPIGTKPHALGAVLACMASPRRIELVYDHPRRKQRRTVGTLRLLVYSISDFLPSPPSSA